MFIEENAALRVALTELQEFQILRPKPKDQKMEPFLGKV
jgi:hypothetical protein